MESGGQSLCELSGGDTEELGDAAHPGSKKVKLDEDPLQKPDDAAVFTGLMSKTTQDLSARVKLCVDAKREVVLRGYFESTTPHAPAAGRDLELRVRRAVWNLPAPPGYPELAETAEETAPIADMRKAFGGP